MQKESKTPVSAAELIRTARKAKHMTLREVASLAGVAHQFVHAIETYNMTATDAVLTRLGRALGIAPRTLIRAADAQRNAAAERRAAELRKASR